MPYPLSPLTLTGLVSVLVPSEYINIDLVQIYFPSSDCGGVSTHLPPITSVLDVLE